MESKLQTRIFSATSFLRFFAFFAASSILLFGSVFVTTSAAFADDTKTAPEKTFQFTDATAEVGLDKALYGAFNHAVAWGDFDNDGRLDLFLGNFADRGSYRQYNLEKPIANQLFRQVAGGKFEPFPCPEVEIAMRCSGAVVADLDNDGDLDVYVTSNRQENPEGEEWQKAARSEGSRLYRNDGNGKVGNGKFVDISKESGACPQTLLRCRDVGVFDFDGDGLLDLLVMQDKGAGPEDKLARLPLFRNLGNLQFEDVSAKVGLPDGMWGVGVAVADLNRDLRPDFYVCGCNRLFLSQSDHTYKEAAALRPVFNPPEQELDWVTGASLGDLDLDGDLDLITGRHHYHGPSRIHVFLNGGCEEGVPQFREVTNDLGLQPLPQKAPHPEIQDFDNDGRLDLYWSAYFAEGSRRWPFICRGLGVKDGLPRFDVPAVPEFDLELVKKNAPPDGGKGMVYYVDGPAVDYDGDGDLDFCACIWPPEPSRFFRNDTKGGHWLQVRVEGTNMNRMGIGAQVRIYRADKLGEKSALLGCQEITLNGGYCSCRPAMVHLGLGKVETCDVEITFPSRSEPVTLRRTSVNRLITVREP